MLSLKMFVESNSKKMRKTNLLLLRVRLLLGIIIVSDYTPWINWRDTDKYTGSFFCMNLATYLADKLAFLMPDLKLGSMSSEPLDYHDFRFAQEWRSWFFCLAGGWFSGSVSEEYDYIVYDAKTLIFRKESNFIRFRQALVFPVNFVGAGPGEPGGLHLKPWKNLKNCDVCFDALVNPQI